MNIETSLPELFDAVIAEKVRKDRVMPASTYAFYCALCACGLIEASYVVLWWGDNWLVAIMSASAAAFVLGPLFVRREFQIVRDIDREAKTDLKAQMLAGNEMLRLARENDAEKLKRQRDEDQKFNKFLFEENAKLIGEVRVLSEKYLPFSPASRKRERGRFVSSKPKALTDGKRSAVNSALVAFVETSEGST